MEEKAHPVNADVTAWSPENRKDELKACSKHTPDQQTALRHRKRRVPTKRRHKPRREKRPSGEWTDRCVALSFQRDSRAICDETKRSRGEMAKPRVAQGKKESGCLRRKRNETERRKKFEQAKKKENLCQVSICLFTGEPI